MERSNTVNRCHVFLGRTVSAWCHVKVWCLNCVSLLYKHTFRIFLACASVCLCERDWQVSRYPGPLRQLWGHHCRVLGLIEGWLENIRGEGGRGGTAVAANYYYPQCSIRGEALCGVGSHTCGLLLYSGEKIHCQSVWVKNIHITWCSSRGAKQENTCIEKLWQTTQSQARIFLC